MTKPSIIAVDEAGDHKTGDLPHTLTVSGIENVLGFPANIDDDGDKVEHSWGFTVDGVRCGIWDYKGGRWSVFDPQNILPELFGLVSV